MMTGYSRDYRSYLLRLWLVQREGGAHWRASLEDVQSGELHGFASLDAMLEYLQALIPQEPRRDLAPAQGDAVGDIENKTNKVRNSKS